MVTVMFADVSGFTGLGERLDPESLQQVMSRYFAAMRLVVARHGGVVEKLIGDAIMALFGVPVLHEDDAVRAARCALEMHAALEALNEDLERSWGVRLQVHTGINTGEVVVSAGDDGDPLTYGDTVNVAQRLQSAANPGEILVGAITARLLRGIGGLVPVGPLRLKGKAAAVEAWRLEAVREDDRRQAGPRAALVGRARELESLRATFDDVVANRRPAVVTLIGPAGIGKSRLAGAMLDAVADRAEFVGGRCLPYGEGITYWPIAEIVRRLADRPEEDALARAAGGGVEGRTIAYRIARVVGLKSGAVAVEEAQWAVRRLLEIRAATRPLVVVLDDIHWAEPTLLDLVEHIASAAADVPLLVLCLARPELLERRPGWGEPGGPSTIAELGPLADADAAALLARLAVAWHTKLPDARRTLATAEGNPFFLEQIVAMAAEPAGDTGTPASIQALLAARVDALPPGERAVIDRAAVEGRGFHRSAVAELLPPADRAGLDDALQALAHRRLILPGSGELPGEAGYRFAHILVRDVAYELLPKAARAELHQRYAAWLERRAGPRYEELVGYHLEQAHRWHAELRPTATAERSDLGAEAARRLSAAGSAALQRGDLPAGINLLERTAALLAAEDPARSPVLCDLGLALVELGRLPGAERVLIEAARAAAVRRDAVAEAHARAAHFFALVQVDPEAASGELAVRFGPMHRVFTAAGDDLGLARLLRARALVYWLLGRTAQAETAWRRGLRHARFAGDEQGIAEGLVWLASAACVGPKRVPTAIADCEAILDQLRADRRSQALSMRPLAVLHAMAGRVDVARDLLARSNAIHAELGATMHAAVAHDEAMVALLAGDPGTAEAVLRPSCARLEEMGEKALLATTVALLARALLEQRRDDEAWSCTDAALEAAAPDDLSAQILWRIVRAQLLARDGGRNEGDRLSAEAVAIAERTDWLVDRADALVARAEVLHAAGVTDDAVRALSQAFDLYTRKGNVVSAARAREAVDAIVA